MNIENLGEIKAVAFDIDGTLYKNWHLYLRMFFHLLRYNQFLFSSYSPHYIYNNTKSKKHNRKTDTQLSVSV